MNNAQRRAKTNGLFLFAIISCLSFFGCEDPGVVGSGFTDSGAEIVVDTIGVSDLDTQSFSYYTGRLTYLSAGRYSDPLFGDLEAVGLLKPGLSTSSTDTIQEEASMRLRLVVNQAQIYGDDGTPAEYDLVEIDQVWRGKSWTIDDRVQLSQGQPVASFSIGREDTINVPLSDSWVQKYRDFYESEAADRDSLYRIEFPGLAMVPRNSAKIVPVYSDSSSFIIENPDADTVEQGLSDWAYSLDRANSPDAPAGTFINHSTFENVMNFDMKLTKDQFGTVNISRVELVVYADGNSLNSSLGGTERRPDISTGNLFLAEPVTVPLAFDAGSPVVQGNFNDEDNSFRFTLTSFVNGVLLDGVPQELEFYFTVQTNNGIIRSSLIHNDRATAARQPKLIITSIQNENE